MPSPLAARFETQRARMVASIETAHPLQASMLNKNAPRYRACLDFIASELRAETRILDYGCGFPFILATLAAAGHDVVGLEPYATAEHDAIAARLGAPGRVLRNIEPDRQFDLVLLIDVIEHLAVPGPTMRDVVSRVRPGGLLAVSTPNGMRFEQWITFVRRRRAHPVSLEEYLEGTDHWTNHQREFTLTELRQTMRFFGLAPVRTDVVDTTPEWTALEAHRRTRGDRPVRAIQEAARGRLKRAIQRVLPRSWQNNLLMLARRPV